MGICGKSRHSVFLMLATVLIIMSILVFVEASAGATTNLLTNGDFETGDLTGWTVFTTANGTNGVAMPDIVLFDTCTAGVENYSVKFNVGTTVLHQPGGGGILQNVYLPGGTYMLQSCTAVLDDRGSSNIDGGLFELLFDGMVVDSYDYGEVELGTTYRSLLSNLGMVTAGMHEVAVRITRTHESMDITPWQYLDDVNLIPEPMTLSLLALGGLLLLGKRRFH